MTRNAAPVTTTYTLNKGDQLAQKLSITAALRRLAPLLRDEKRTVALAFVAMLTTNGTALLGPAIIARAVDRYIQGGNFQGVLLSAGLLLGIYLCGLLGSYYQTLAMG